MSPFFFLIAWLITCSLFKKIKIVCSVLNPDSLPLYLLKTAFVCPTLHSLETLQAFVSAFYFLFIHHLVEIACPPGIFQTDWKQSISLFVTWKEVFCTPVMLTVMLPISLISRVNKPKLLISTFREYMA